MIKWNLRFIAEKAPEFLNRITLECKCLQETLHFFIVGHWPFYRCRFMGVFVVFVDGTNDIFPITVNIMEKVFFLLNM